jgi:thiamine kinase-like enzyme
MTDSDVSTGTTIPETLAEQLTPEWLEPVLSTRFPGVEITAVTPGPIVERVSTNARFTIEGTIPDGLPSALCAKGYFSEAGRGSSAASVPEVSFYRDLAHPVGVRTLNSVWADIDPATNHGVVITEDAVEAGATFCSALDFCSVDRVADQLAEFAKLHAYAWEQPDFVASNEWAATRLEFILNVRGLKEISANFDGPNGAAVPDGTRNSQALVDAYRHLSSRTPGAGWTIAHGDAHVGNTFVDRDGRGCLVDWQVIQFAPWGIDVGYHIASALEPDVRAANERDLLQHYLDALGAAGVSDVPSWDVAWDEYRMGIVHGLFLWGITQYVRPEVIAQLLRRLGTAADDHGSYQLLAAV